MAAAKKPAKKQAKRKPGQGVPATTWRAVVAEYQATGNTPASLGLKYGIHRSTVAAYFKRHGITPDPTAIDKVRRDVQAKLARQIASEETTESPSRDPVLAAAIDQVTESTSRVLAVQQQEIDELRELNRIGMAALKAHYGMKGSEAAGRKFGAHDLESLSFGKGDGLGAYHRAVVAGFDVLHKMERAAWGIDLADKQTEAPAAIIESGMPKRD